MLNKFLVSVFLIFSLVGGIPFSNAASLTWTFEGNTVILNDTPCQEKKVLEKIKPEYHNIFQSGTVVFKGDKLNLCWTPSQTQPGYIYVMDETGDYGTIPMDAFRPREAI